MFHLFDSSASASGPSSMNASWSVFIQTLHHSVTCLSERKPKPLWKQQSNTDFGWTVDRSSTTAHGWQCWIETHVSQGYQILLTSWSLCHSAVFIAAFSFAMWLKLTLSLDAGVIFPGRQVACLRQSRVLRQLRSDMFSVLSSIYSWAIQVMVCKGFYDDIQMHKMHSLSGSQRTKESVSVWWSE